MVHRRRAARRRIAWVRPKIEAIVVYNSNPAAVAPQSARVARVLARRPVHRRARTVLTDTADHADIVLPATTQLEHLDVHGSYGHTSVLFNEPAIAPLGEARPNTQIFRDLAARMGYDDPCFADSDEALARQAFGDAVPFDELRARGWWQLPRREAPFAAGALPP